jgi:hypothetical protein
MSEKIDQIAEALIAVQSEMGTVTKENENPYFKSKYADLAAVHRLCMPILTKNGLCVSQVCAPSEKGVKIVTLLLHKSGQYLGSELEMIPTKMDPQGIGSAITYARRYALMAIIGLVAEEDDDGNAASTPPQKYNAPKKYHTPTPKSNATSTFGELYSQYVKLGLKKQEIQKRWEKLTGKSSTADMGPEDVELIKNDLKIAQSMGEVPELMVVTTEG